MASPPLREGNLGPEGKGLPEALLGVWELHRLFGPLVRYSEGWELRLAPHTRVTRGQRDWSRALPWGPCSP